MPENLEDTPVVEERSYSADIQIKFTWPPLTDAVTRITKDGGDDWRSHFYPLYTEQDVLEHWAYNALVNGITKVSQLEGWADLEPHEDVRITVAYVQLDQD